MEIEICNRCDGKGTAKSMDGLGDYTYDTCKKCNGTGRLFTRTYKYQVAMDYNISKLHTADAEICNIIRAMENNTY